MFLGLRSRPAPASQGLKIPGGLPTPAPCTGCLGSLEGQNSPPQRGRGTPSRSQPQDPGRPLGPTPTGHAAAPAPPGCRASSSSFTPLLRHLPVTPQGATGPAKPTHVLHFRGRA